MKSVKLKFWLWVAKKKNGSCPLHMRILVDGVKTEISLGIQLREQEWNDKKEIVKTSNNFCISYNLRLSKLREAFDTAVSYIIENGMELSAKAIKEVMFPKKEKEVVPVTFEELTKVYFEDLTKGKQHADGTLERYKRVAKLLGEYLGKSFELKKLNTKLLYDFEKHLLQNEYQMNTVVRFIKTCKTIVNYAIKNEFIDFNPFLAHKGSRLVKKPIKYLTEEELSRIEQKDFENKRLNQIKDCFLMQAYTGMSYSDLYSFRMSDVRIIEGRQFIVKHRKKTEVSFNVPLLKKAALIMEKYNWKLPMLSNQKMNTYLKEIGTLCDLNIELTSHIGRKTFATLALSKGVPVETVSRMVGHSSVKMTLDNYAEIMPSKMLHDVSVLED